MRTRIAVIIGTYLAAQLALASTPASAGSRIRAREVVGGLNQPVAFTFGPAGRSGTSRRGRAGFGSTISTPMPTACS